MGCCRGKTAVYRKQRLRNVCGAGKGLYLFRFLHFRIEIITQNRIFCKYFNKTTALITKIHGRPCFFCASCPHRYTAAGSASGGQWRPRFLQDILARTYSKIYFRMNSTVSTYIRGLIFFSRALPVMRFSNVQEMTPMAIPSEML